MKLLDIEFDDRLFTTGQLQGRLATVVGYKKLVSDCGITHLMGITRNIQFAATPTGVADMSKSLSARFTSYRK